MNIKKNIEYLEKSFNKKNKNLEDYIKNQDNIIKDLVKRIKNVDYKILILNQQIEIFFSYLDNIKNESCIIWKYNHYLSIIKAERSFRKK